MRLAEAKKITNEKEYNQRERMRRTIEEEGASAGG
jgi:hypothetical protein